MIPHKIRMKGFGSYLKETVIDFDSVDSIFLIDGYTGAGKSLILDALTYSLYGRSSGERTAVMSRCLHGKEREMEVDFIFETAGRMYEFQRREWYTKPRSKSKDENDGRFQSSACVFDITEERKQINSKNTYSEVNKLAENILHMTCDQFCQIVVLPQGKIEKLLTGGSGDKEELFTELFGTRYISDIMDILNSRCRDHLSEVEKKRVGLEKYYSPDFESISALRERLELLKEEHSADKAALAEKEKAYSTLSVKSEAAFKLAARFDELDKQKRILSELKAREDEFAHKKAELETIEAQINSMSEYSAYKSAEKNLSFRRSERLNAETVKGAADGELSSAAKAVEDFKSGEETAANARKKYEALSKLTELYGKISTAEKEYSSALSAAEQSAENYKKAAQLRAKWENSLKLTEEKVQKLQSENIAVGINTLTEDKFRMEKGRELSEEISEMKGSYEKLKGDWEESCRRCSSADEIMKGLTEDYEKSFKAHINGLAAELSKNLAEGEKCPVCGSVHHPEPFHTINTAIITAEQLKKKKAVLDKSSEKLSGMKRERDGFKRDMERLSADISAKITKSAEYGYTAEKYSEITAEISKLKEKQAELSRLEETVRQLNTEQKNAAAAERLAADKNAEDKTRLAAAEKELFMLRQSRAEGIENIAELNNEMCRCEELFTRYDKGMEKLSSALSAAENKALSAKAQLEAAEKELLSAEEKYKSAYEGLEKVLTENGITQKAERYIPDESVIKSVGELRKQCAEFDAQLKSTAQTIADISSELDGRERLDTDKLRQELDALTEEINAAREKAALRAEEISRLDKLSDSYEKAAGEYDKEVKTAAERKAFTDMMCGGRKMSFPRYVLGVMLDNVLARANIMLEGVLDSNYRLYKQMERAGSTKTGLDINVINYSIDAAGADYSVRMLSGGEKFVMSVILGLAIAETVQNRSGGIEVNSLFIDEGFGTLDNAALEQILQILQSCGAGKKIGIISHVEALEVIPTGFEVTKNPIDGSVVKLRE